MLKHKWLFSFEDVDRLFAPAWALQWPTTDTLSMHTLDTIYIVLPLGRPGSSNGLLLNSRYELTSQQLVEATFLARYGRPEHVKTLDCYNEKVDEFVAYPEDPVEDEAKFSELSELQPCKYLQGPNLRLYTDSRRWEYRTKVIGQARRSNVSIMQLEWTKLEGENLGVVLLSNNFVFFFTLPSKTSNTSGYQPEIVHYNRKVMNYIPKSPLCIGLKTAKDDVKLTLMVAGTKKGLILYKVYYDHTEKEYTSRPVAKYVAQLKFTSVKWVDDEYFFAGDSRGGLYMFKVTPYSSQDVITPGNSYHMVLCGKLYMRTGLTIDHIEFNPLFPHVLVITSGFCVVVVDFDQRKVVLEEDLSYNIFDEKISKVMLIKKLHPLKQMPCGIVYNELKEMWIVLDSHGGYTFYDKSFDKQILSPAAEEPGTAESNMLLELFDTSKQELLYRAEAKELYTENITLGKKVHNGLVISPNSQFLLTISVTLDAKEIKLRAISTKYSTLSMVPFHSENDSNTKVPNKLYKFDIAYNNVMQSLFEKRSEFNRINLPVTERDEQRRMLRVVREELADIGKDGYSQQAEKIVRIANHYATMSQKVRTKVKKKEPLSLILKLHADLGYLYCLKYGHLFAEDLLEGLKASYKRLYKTYDEFSPSLEKETPIKYREDIFGLPTKIDVGEGNELGMYGLQTNPDTPGMDDYISRCGYTLLVIGSDPVAALNGLYCPWCFQEYVDFRKVDFLSDIFSKDECVFCKIPLLGCGFKSLTD